MQDGWGIKEVRNMEKIIISGINMTEGGILSIFKDCLQNVDKLLTSKYKIIALVHNKNLFSDLNLSKEIEFIEFEDSKSSWFKRCYYEYFYFKKLSKKLKPYLWLSLHDITPNVESEKLAVYCHNSTPFYDMNFKDIKYDKKVFLFSKFYKYLYKINIKKNNYVIVQQNWIKEEFKKMYGIKNIIVAPPENNYSVKFEEKKEIENNSFFYPSFPRVFKNFEIICQAVELLEKENINNFKVYLTIDGSENLYSKEIIEKYKNLKCIEFLGLIPREKVFENYSRVECLIFPSKLETWGLPISEFKQFNKPIILSELPYAHETIGDFDKCLFFNPNSAEELKNQMLKIINKENKFSENKKEINRELYAENWEELFEILLEEK